MESCNAISVCVSSSICSTASASIWCSIIVASNGCIQSGSRAHAFASRGLGSLLPTTFCSKNNKVGQANVRACRRLTAESLAVYQEPLFRRCATKCPCARLCLDGCPRCWCSMQVLRKYVLPASCMSSLGSQMFVFVYFQTPCCWYTVGNESAITLGISCGQRISPKSWFINTFKLI